MEGSISVSPPIRCLPPFLVRRSDDAGQHRRASAPDDLARRWPAVCNQMDVATRVCHSCAVCLLCRSLCLLRLARFGWGLLGRRGLDLHPDASAGVQMREDIAQHHTDRQGYK